MGTVFRYIADAALSTSSGRCQCCEDASKPAYDYGFGVIAEPAKAANPKLARAEPEIHVACRDCIESGLVKKDLVDVERQISLSGSSAGALLRRSVHLIPTIPVFVQRWEWPICCDDWCEFAGSPHNHDELVTLTKTHSVWPPGFQRDFVNDGPPESFAEISAFRCLSCNQRYFVDQFT